MQNYDYLIVGSGLTGAVMARLLTDAGKTVLVVDRRNHMGGNVHDHAHNSGIRIHTYGPHYFRTVSDEIWAFVNRFATFYRYEACIQSQFGTTFENWPIAASYIKRTIGATWQPEFKAPPSNFEEAALSLMPRRIYELFIKEYNEKQWGVPAQALSADLCKRFDVRLDDEPRLMPKHKYQGLPVDGYAALMQRILAGIPVLLNVDYLRQRDTFKPSKLTIFTGPIDEYFDFSLGRLHYRGQKRTSEYLPDTDRYQPLGQINNPLHVGGPHIRTLEWKQMMQPELAARSRGTVLTREVTYSPTDPTDYEYPFPDAGNKALYQRYRQMADALPETLVCGRLGEYKYYDMDHAIARAMTMTRKLLTGASILAVSRNEG